MKKQKMDNEEHLAKAKAKDLPISTKQSIEICRCLRYKNTVLAVKILNEALQFKKAIPFKKFIRDMGHKPGIASGRYPQKASQAFIKLIRTVEANAQFKGLNTSNLKITKILANKAAIPLSGGRHHTAAKRTNLEIEVKEMKEKKKKNAEKGVPVKKDSKPSAKKPEAAPKQNPEKRLDEEKPVKEEKINKSDVGELKK